MARNDVRTTSEAETFANINGSMAQRVYPIDMFGNTTVTINANQWKFDYTSGSTDYIGMHSTYNASTSDSNWIIYKFTYSTGKTTLIQKTQGSWDNRATLF